MVIDKKKCAIRLNVETHIPESLRDIPRIDETTYKYLGFEMKKGEVEQKDMSREIEERVREEIKEQTRRVDDFEARNWIHSVNRNVLSVVKFNSGPVKFTRRWLDRIDRTIHKRLIQQEMLLKRGMATSHLYMKSDAMGMGLKR